MRRRACAPAVRVGGAEGTAEPDPGAVRPRGAAAAADRRHSAADNALFLAGLVREVRGDCAGALQLFERVPLKYPAGDAVPQAQLERGRCLRILGRKDEAKSVLKQLAMEHPHASET